MRIFYGIRFTVIAIAVVVLLGFPAIASAAGTLGTLVDGTLNLLDNTVDDTTDLLGGTVDSLAPGLSPTTDPLLDTLDKTVDSTTDFLDNTTEPVVKPLDEKVVDPLLRTVDDTVDPILNPDPGGGPAPDGSAPPVAPESDGQNPMAPSDAAPGTPGAAGGDSFPTDSQALPAGFFQDPGSPGPGSPGQWGLGRFENGGPGGTGTIANMKVAPAGSPNELFSAFSPSSGLAILPMLGLFSGLLGLAAYFKSARQIWQAGA